jgi:hypothetical protein
MGLNGGSVAMDSGSGHIFRDGIPFMALSVILSVYGADPIAEEVILHFTLYNQL